MTTTYRTGRDGPHELHIMTDGRMVESGRHRGTVEGWTRIVVLTSVYPPPGRRGSVKRRLYVLEPAEGLDAVRFGELFVEGPLHYAWHTTSGREASSWWERLRVDFRAEVPSRRPGR